MGVRIPDFLQNIHTGASMHRDIEQNEIPFLLPDSLKSLRSVARFTESCSLKLIRQNSFQALAKKRMVVNDQNIHRFGPLAGMRTMTVVPFPEIPDISMEPPRIAARSRMPSSPSA